MTPRIVRRAAQYQMLAEHIWLHSVSTLQTIFEYRAASGYAVAHAILPGFYHRSRSSDLDLMTRKLLARFMNIALLAACAGIATTAFCADPVAADSITINSNPDKGD